LASAMLRGMSCLPCMLRPWADARAARRRNPPRNSPGTGGLEDKEIPIAVPAVPSTSASTTRPINSGISPQLGNAIKLFSKKGLSIWSPFYESILASTAARATPSCSSSTIFETRSSGSQAASEVANGKTSSTRLQSATWFVQTVIDVAPLSGVASSARR